MSETSLMKSRNIIARAFGIISSVALAYMTYAIAFRWNHLPEEIPKHFNFLGEIDAVGGKSTLLVLLGIAWILFTTLTIIELIPNSDKMLPPDQFRAQLSILAESISILKAILMVDFAYICNRSLAFDSLGRWFAPVFLLMIFGQIITMSMKLVRNNKKR